MKAVSGVPTSPLEGLPHPESRHTVLTKLETNEYVLRVPRGGKSVVWKIFLNVTNLMGIKIDFVLCRYCCGLFMYKGYASGTSSLMNHGIRCLDRPKKNDTEKPNGSVVVQEEWPDAFKSKSYFTLNYLKRFKIGDTRSPSPVSPVNYSLPSKIDCSSSQMYNSIVETAAGDTNSQAYHHHMIKEELPSLQHFPLYTALHVAAQNFGIPLETLLKFTDELAGNGSNHQRSMMSDEGSDMSVGGGAVGLSGIEAVVAAAAAAAAAAGETGTAGGTTATSVPAGVVAGATDGGGTSMTGPVTVTSVSGNREQQCRGGGGGGSLAGMNSPAPSVTGASTPNKPESYQLRHNNHLSLVLNQLAEDEAFMDVTLTAEGRPIKAHKSVLSAVSPYFSSVLRANPCQHPIIIMPRDIRYIELSHIIMYIYRGEMTVSAEDLPSLLKTAELLRITGLSPGDNQQQPVPNGKASSNVSGSQSFTGNFSPTNSFSTTVNSNISGFNNQYNKSSMSRQDKNTGNQQQQETHHHDKNDKSEDLDAPPSPVQTLLNPSDFMDLDMTCVKEEMNSDDDQEENDAIEQASREVTTPPAIENPLSSNDNKHGNKECSPQSQPILETPPDGSGISTSTDSSKSRSLTETTTTESDSDADLKRNSLKTLASLANLDTPTNLSPSECSSLNDGNSQSPEPSPNICPYCSDYIPGDISTHLSSKHAFKPAFVCTTCKRVYTRKLTLETHSINCVKDS